LGLLQQGYLTLKHRKLSLGNLLISRLGAMMTTLKATMTTEVRATAATTIAIETGDAIVMTIMIVIDLMDPTVPEDLIVQTILAVLAHGIFTGKSRRRKLTTRKM
jgi:hypothetical protein